jgi:uncharacterized protein (UPF0261 family)
MARSEVAAHHSAGAHFLGSTDRGEAVAAMGEASVLSTRGDIDALLGIDGGGGTFNVTKGMQSRRIGVPKLMVSTLAAGDVGRYVDVADVSMMPSVNDRASLHNISQLRNAAFGIVGMASVGPAAGTGKPPMALTMFA